MPEHKKVYDDLKDVLIDQIKKISKKGDISPTELHNVYEAIDVIKDMSTIEAMEKADKEYEEMQGGEMQGYSARRGGNYSRGYSQHYMPMWAYDGSYGGSYEQSNRREQMSRDGMPSGNMPNGMSNDGMRGYSGEQWGNSRDYSRESGYSNESSYRRGRDARTGRYVSRDSGSYDGSYRRGEYSRASEKERMLDKLHDMLDDASSEREMKAIEQCIDRISR